MKNRKDNLITVGIVSNATKVFNNFQKKIFEDKWRGLFAYLIKSKVINKNSIFYPKRIFSPHECNDVIDKFIRSKVEVIIIVNSGFPHGHVFTTFAVNPYLSGIPIILTAGREPVISGMPEWQTNAWCGVIMNNYSAKQLGRYVKLLAGNPDESNFKEQLIKLFNVYSTVAKLHNEYIGRIGDAPGGFHSATGNELAYTKKFGIKIETVDLSNLMEIYKTGKASGYLGKISFTENDVRETFKDMKKGRIVLIDDEYIYKSARLYHAVKALIESNGFTSISFRCWPEMQEKYINLTPCFTLGWLMGKRDVTAASCESDWPVLVSQIIGSYISCKPSACLDFVNYTGGSEIVQLGHCGVGICGYMEKNPSLNIKEVSLESVLKGKVRVNDGILEHGVLRHINKKIGPVHIGQFKYGIKTGICMIQTPEGRFKMLVFKGESSPDTRKNILYSASDVRVKNYNKLDRIIQEHGFAHHLAVCFGDITEELEELCKFYNIEFISPDKD